MNFFDTEQFVKRGETLQADIRTFAARLVMISQASIEAANPVVCGVATGETTEVGEEWPLTDIFIIEARLIDMALPDSLAGNGRIVETRKPTTSWVEPFTDDRFTNDSLERAYGQEAPREAFVSDVIGWAEAMNVSGWPVLSRIVAKDRGKVEVSVYQDTELARAYFEYLVDANNVSKGGTAGGVEPYSRLSEWVIVDDSAIAARVSLSEE